MPKISYISYLISSIMPKIIFVVAISVDDIVFGCVELWCSGFFFCSLGVFEFILNDWGELSRDHRFCWKQQSTDEHRIDNGKTRIIEMSHIIFYHFRRRVFFLFIFTFFSFSNWMENYRLISITVAWLSVDWDKLLQNQSPFIDLGCVLIFSLLPYRYR